MASASLNDYANSMFRHELLPEHWIESCTRYVRHLFGDDLCGRVICDYGFGRGNWALAFARLGATKIYCVDASISNVERFGKYCQAHGLYNIEVLHGNLVEKGLPMEGVDFFWLYGVFHHIPTDQQRKFLFHLKDRVLADDALLYVYYYNSGSLRDFVVTACRSIVRYPSEDAFIQDSPLFTRAARVRARDDLVAPFVDFRSISELSSMLLDGGFTSIRSDPDFQEFLHHRKPMEFRPHQILAKRGKTVTGQEIRDQRDPMEADVALLRLLWQDLISSVDSLDFRRKIAIGLFNSHFSSSRDFFDGDTTAIEDGLFLLSFLRSLSSKKQTGLHSRTQAYLRLSIASQADQSRSALIDESQPTRLRDYLIKHSVRA